MSFLELAGVRKAFGSTVAVEDFNLAAERGDAMVLRFYSPMRTLGGARVLDAAHRRVRLDLVDAVREEVLGDRGRHGQAGVLGVT